MADSGHFDGSTFQGLDDDATRNEAPFNAALEAKIANNNHFLHRFGGGTCVRRFLNGTAVEITTANRNYKNTFVWTSFHQQPFLLTKGLNKIRILMHLTVENYSLDLKADLDGVSYIGPTISPVASDNQFVVFEIELDTPIRNDKVTLLALYARAASEAIPDPAPTPSDVQVANGVGYDLGVEEFTETTDRAIVTWQDNGQTFADPVPPPYTISDPIFRKLEYPTTGGNGKMALSPYNFGSYFYFEIEIARVTLRCIQINQEFV